MAKANIPACASAQPFPASDLWIDQLRWCICVLPNDDEDMGFIASLFSYAHYHGGLTERQQRAARNVIRRIKAEMAL